MRARLLVLVLVLGVACGGSRPHPAARDVARSAAAVTAIGDAYVKAFLAEFPEQADLAGLLGASHAGLTDHSLAARRAWDQRVDGWLAELGRVDADALWGQPAWETYGYLRHVLESRRELRICRRELWPLDHLAGWQANAVVLAQRTPVATAEDRAAALDRFGRVARYIDDDRANATEGLRLGYSSPRSVVDLVAHQLDTLLAGKLEASPLYDPARRSDDPAFQARWRQLLETDIVPALRRYRAFLDTYRPRAREALGVSANPDGAQCYAASFRAYTTLTRPAEETVRMGRERVAQNTAEVKAMTRAAFQLDDLPAVVARLDADPQNHFKDKAELQAFVSATIARARAALPRWFGALPTSDVTLEPVADYLEASAPSSYRPAAQDGSRPATYVMNLGHPEQQLRSNVEITALHETFPGHHLQVGLESDRRQQTIALLAGNSAFREGWARYAEALAEEMGLYTSTYAKVHRRLWPSRGMVVDPGIHLQGWTRKQAVDFMAESGRFTPAECDALVDRITVWPGQLTAYDTGALEFFALRSAAEHALGSRFDLKAFHDAVLAHGAVTLPMLREIGRRWIAAQR